MATIFIGDKSGPRNRKEPAGRSAAGSEPGLLEMLSLSNWRRLMLETLVILAAIVILKHWFLHSEIPGLPHLYWLPVLLASSQYGVVGGMIATVAASTVYVLELPPASGAQDFYAYVSAIAVHPAVWLATALVIGGLRSLQIHHADELADQLALCRRRGSEVAQGLARALTEINALEQRIATDAATVAAFTRGLSRIDLSTRSAAVASLGELFRIGVGTSDFTIYLRSRDSYVPVVAVENDMARPVTSNESLKPALVDTVPEDDARGSPATSNESGATAVGARTILIQSSKASTEPLAVIVYKTLPEAQDEERLQRRIAELSRAFAVILSASPEQQT